RPRRSYRPHPLASSPWHPPQARARSREREPMLPASTVRTYRPTPLSRAACGAIGSSVAALTGVDTTNREKKNSARAHVGGCIALSSIRIAVTRPLTRAAGRDLAEGSVGSGGERATRLPLRSVASSRRPRTEHGSGG